MGNSSTNFTRLENLTSLRNKVIYMSIILFICGGNVGRSQCAEGFFNKLTKKHKAISAGTEPGDSVKPMTTAIMKDFGVDISKQKPKLFTKEMISKANKIVVLGSKKEFPKLKEIKAEYWNIPDLPTDIENRREKIKLIKGKVEILIKKLG